MAERVQRKKLILLIKIARQTATIYPFCEGSRFFGGTGLSHIRLIYVLYFIRVRQGPTNGLTLLRSARVPTNTNTQRTQAKDAQVEVPY